MSPLCGWEQRAVAVLLCAAEGDSPAGDFSFPQLLPTHTWNRSVLLMFGHLLCSAGSGPRWHRRPLAHAACLLVQRALGV